LRRGTGFLALAVAACLLAQLAFPTVAAAKRPGPSPSPSATPAPTPTPSPPPPDSAVTFQINATHTGAQSGDALRPPLARRWGLDFGGTVPYPLIADGKVFVTEPADANGHVGLFALDQRTGRSVWGPVVLSISASAPKFALAAYDGGRVFVHQGDNVLSAFDSGTGALDWRTALPGQAFAEAVPTPSNGVVYAVGEAVGATVYAVSEASGGVLWATPALQLAGDSSPVVTGTGVTVADDCNVYDLSPTTGAQVWRHSNGCSSGSGLTPVLYRGLLYVREKVPAAGIVLDGATGAQVGTFVPGPAPAFDGNQGFFVVGGRLEAHDLTTGAVTWTFAERDALGGQVAGDDTLASAPAVASGYVYVASTEGWLFAIAEATGRAAWSDRVGVGFQLPEFAALAIGQGGLAVPFGKTLVFYTAAPATSPSPQPAPGLDQARSYQLDPQHTGGQDADPLQFPLARRWTAATSGLPSYPLIAGGHVYFTDGARLLALDEADGSAAWGPVTLPQTSLLAYDGGGVFALGSGGAIAAFDAVSGAQRWAAQLPGSGFQSYPTAAGGAVYVAASGALLAVSEQSGAVLWSQSVLGSGDSSPVVTGSGVYLAYPCPEVYDFDPVSGALIWHVGPSSCTAQASGPRTAVLSNGRLYVRDTSSGLVLDAATGAQLGVFRSTSLPAFSGSMAFFTEESSVEGWDLTTGSLVWRWDADPLLANTAGCPGCSLSYRIPTGPPVVVNGFVLFSLGQNAYALDGRTGRQVWTGVLGVSTDIGTISAGEGLLALTGGPTPAFPSAAGAVTVYTSGGTVNPPGPTAADEAVTHQVDATHTGGQGGDALTPPLAQEWSMDLGGPVTYPLIAGGRAFFAVGAASGGSVLHAVDLATGANVWGPVGLTGPATGCPAILAADSGRVFVQESGILHAFDAGSGTELWSRIVGGSMQCPAPVASGGRLFAGAMRLDEETGAEVWEMAGNAARFDAVTATDVSVDAGCVADMAPADGTVVWGEGGTCGGQPLLAPALYGGRVYTQDSGFSATPAHPILDASTGAPVTDATGAPLTYASQVSPAFAGSLAYFMVGGVLEAHALPDLGLAWTFAGDGSLVTAPVVANGVVYIGSSGGTLYGVDAATGGQVWTANVGAAMSSPDPVFAPELTGLAVGEGWLLVPAGTRLVAYSTSTPAARSRASRR